MVTDIPILEEDGKWTKLQAKVPVTEEKAPERSTESQTWRPFDSARVTCHLGQGLGDGWLLMAAVYACRPTLSV
jgi:hypothetical protein